MNIEKTYRKRLWIGELPSTASFFAYRGPSQWGEGEIMFVEISDCHGKIRIHKSNIESVRDFAGKLENLSNALYEFYSILLKENS